MQNTATAEQPQKALRQAAVVTDRIPVALVHVISGTDRSKQVTQADRLLRIALEIDALATGPLEHQRKQLALNPENLGLRTERIGLLGLGFAAQVALQIHLRPLLASVGQSLIWECAG